MTWLGALTLRRWLAALCLLLAACTGPVQEATRPLAPATLVGEWRVAEINGQVPNRRVEIALSITADRISFEPTCAGFIWTYEYTASRIALERYQPPEPIVAAGEVPILTRLPCAVGLLPEWEQLATALDTAEKVNRTPKGVLISGNGRSVLLFSQ